MTRSVLIVTSQARSFRSGIGTYAEMILSGMRQLPPGTARITVATWREEIDRREEQSLDWLDLGEQSSFDPSPEKLFSLGRRLRHVLSLREQRFDVVHFLDARDGHLFVGSPMQRDVEVIGTVHADYAARTGWSPLQYLGIAANPLRHYLSNRRQRRLEKRCFPKFDHIMVNSRTTGDAVRNAYGIDDDRTTCITLTVDPEPPDVPPAELLGEPSLLFVGDDFYRRGLDECVRAFPDILKELPDAHLHVAGQCRSAPKILRLIESCGVAGAIILHGPVSRTDIAAMLAGADMFVMPSRAEALGLTCLEAYRAGVPVIAGDRGGVTEIVHDRASGILVTPNSPTALASTVVMLAHNAALREQIIAGGRKILAERTPERLIHETLAAYGLILPRTEPGAVAVSVSSLP